MEIRGQFDPEGLALPERKVEMMYSVPVHQAMTTGGGGHQPCNIDQGGHYITFGVKLTPYFG